MDDLELAPRVYAELPSGEYLIPGVSSACGGPTTIGLCSVSREGSVRPCEGAVWFFPGETGWRTASRAPGSVCPVAALDPLGPLAIPLD